MKKNSTIIKLGLGGIIILAILFYLFPGVPLSETYKNLLDLKTAIAQTINPQTNTSNIKLDQLQLAEPVDCQNFESDTFVPEMLSLTNEERKQNNKAPLVWSPDLCQSAKLKANDMIAHKYFDHTSPTGIAPWYWFKKSGYDYVFIGENLSLNYYTPQSANQALMDSQGHRENILNDKFQQVGIATIRGKINNRDVFIVVQHFGSPTLKKIPLPLNK